MKESTNAYEHPQPHACFIQSITDDLVNPGGIMDLWVREARIFKYGSGTGSNFSCSPFPRPHLPVTSWAGPMWWTAILSNTILLELFRLK
jgi:hypothetical protein